MRKVTESNEMGDKKSNAKGESPHLIAARIHAILARESDTAVVFRRGPSNKTAVLKWDLQTDSFDLGQWFYGSFYPYRCDISPDGRHLVYFAAKYGRGSSMDEYIESRIKAELGEISWFHGGQYYQRMERIVNDSATRRERERQIKTGEYSDWSWADYDRPRARVVFAANGAIYSLRCKGFLAAPKKLHDFNNMKYERIKAPY